MARGPMSVGTGGGGVVVTDPTFTAEGVAADAKAVGDALSTKAPNTIFAGSDAGLVPSSDKSTAKYLRADGSWTTVAEADNASKWSGKTLRLQHNTSDTWIPVISGANVDYILKTEIANSYVAAKGSNYIRFSNGFQLCWATVNGFSAYGAWVGYPMTFGSTPVVVVASNKDEKKGVYFARDVGASGFNIDKNEYGDGYGSYIAIGWA